MNSPKKCLYMQEKNPSTLIRKILPLLESQITRDDVQRHIEMISEFIELSEHGFYVQDLPYVTRLINILTDRADDVSTYEELLKGIVEICSIPPLLMKSSDVLTFTLDLQELFAVLGFLLVCLKNNDLRFLVVAALTNLMKTTTKPKWYSSLDIRKKAADDSRLSEILGQYLAIADDEIYPELLLLIILLIKDCTKSYKVLLYQDTLNSLLRRIEPSWRRRYPNIRPIFSSDDKVLHYENTAFIIYELLDYLDKNRKDLDVKNIDQFSMWNIQYAFKVFVDNKNQLDRNNVMAMLIKLMDLFPKAEFMASGIYEDIIDRTTNYIFRIDSPRASQLTLTSSEDDYIFVKLGLLAILMVAEFDGGVRILENVRIIHRLLRSIWHNGVPRYFSTSYSCVIQIYCWNVLKELVPYMYDEFIENSGPSMLTCCMKESNKSEEGLTILTKCLETTSHILKDDPQKVIANSIIYNDGTSIVLDLCEQFLSKPILCATLQTCVRLSFCILKKLYESVSQLPDELVHLAIKCFKRVLNPYPNETIFDNRIVICPMDFVWETIIKSENLSTLFIRNGGVYLMLDIIQQFPFNVQIFTLGALVDLCEDENCVPYLITWTGLRKVTLISLLMEIFRYENELLEVSCGPDGQILESAFPIIGKEQRNQTYRDQNVQSQPAISDLFLSSRPKIYALLSLLYDRHEEMFEMADEQYKTSINDLSAKDKITLLLAENFLALKLGEAWVELQVEFNAMNFNPLPMDHIVMTSLVTRYHRWGEYLRKAQIDVLREAKAKELINEQKLYNTFGESRLKDCLEALEELKYIARCTERMFRISQKYKQQCQVQKSLRKIPRREFLNKTYFSSLGVTTKKVKVLTRKQIDRFLLEASDDKYLMMKVVLVFGVAGPCRGNELVQLSVNDVRDMGSTIIDDVKNTKNKIERTFVIKNGQCNPVKHVELCRKYIALRPPEMNLSRFFIYYKNNKCTVQPIGKNTFGQIPRNIATFLKLPDASLYMGHCFRRSSASLLSDSGATVDVLKRHGGWKSSAVAEGYVENFITNKESIAGKILDYEMRPPSPVASTSQQTRQEHDISSLSSNVHLSNINNRPFSFINCNNVSITYNVNSINKDL